MENSPAKYKVDLLFPEGVFIFLSHLYSYLNFIYFFIYRPKWIFRFVQVSYVSVFAGLLGCMFLEGSAHVIFIFMLQGTQIPIKKAAIILGI